MLNTIANGFARDGETSSTRKKHVRKVLNIEDLPNKPKEGEIKAPEVEIVTL